MPTDTDLLNELKKISKILTLSSGSVLEKELSKYATTDERKIIWVLIDGKNNAEDIAKMINKTKRAVDAFLSTLEKAELIDERKYGVPPIRRLDYIPSEWVPLVPKQPEESPSPNNKQDKDEKNG